MTASERYFKNLFYIDSQIVFDIAVKTGALCSHWCGNCQRHQPQYYIALIKIGNYFNRRNIAQVRYSICKNIA